SVFTLSLVAVPTVVLAVEEAANPQTLNTTSANDTTDNQQDRKARLQERLSKRKADLKTQLSLVQKNRLTGRCKAAQGMISSVGGRIKGVETRRTQAYGVVVSKLKNLST